MADEIGRVLGGRYRLLSPLGAGASAQVYLADDVRLRRRVAVKILHAGLAFTDAVDPETSVVICNQPEPEQGKGYQAHELGVPLVSDAEFMDCLDGVVGGIDIEDFTDDTLTGGQFKLF